VQVVAGAFDHEDQLLPHVPVDARFFAGLEKLHVGFDAHLARVQLLVHEVLDQSVGAVLPRHVLGVDDVGLALVGLAEFGRSFQLVGAEGGGLVAGQRRLAIGEAGHGARS
jgi:hypothetical protein